MLCKTNGGGWEKSSLFFTMALDEHSLVNECYQLLPSKGFKVDYKNERVLDARKTFYFTPPELTITR